MDDLLLNKITESEELEFYTAETTSDLKIPLIESQVSAGFPSPADDYMDLPIDLNEFLIKHPSATFYVRVKGDSMEGAGIRNGDLLIVDRAEEPRNKSIVLGIINGEFTVKRIMKKSGDLFLIPDNPDYKPIKIDDNMEFQVWGVVTYVVHKPE
ncbi:MAG TPA: translesion error-prone DNA polymerase V autoproteolytic subunit [Candidatus Marinimicrobia bacterium]|jgi:DNA polymerase V|nr:peptidase S24 [Candidatus Neomarinimicrobiota bacterium]HJM70465.1 translesion error-prone DNA polymerase V autoproteolytic subunit [Candidatus Neomarinimicrobiota bacterium]|tara:strand:+ start:1678 stop:2139 length:462 start_codon:yes stop_codon:yes gene_type:complete